MRAAIRLERLQRHAAAAARVAREQAALRVEEYKQKQKIYTASWADHKSTDDKAPFCCSLQARAAAPSPFFLRAAVLFFILACQRRAN